MDQSDEDGRDGRLAGRWYADSFDVGHNAFEFTVDCGQQRVNGEVVTVYFRVIASPISARELFRLLGMGLLRYADTFGPIDGKGGAGAWRGAE
ncbi:MAG TPA: DUF3467 domain-containing protein [Vicinamibacteria bacterium]